jgi:hypothetical protein
MYIAMTQKTNLDSKIKQIFQKTSYNMEPTEEAQELIDFDTFNKFVSELQEDHQKKCGPECIHLQRFYSRIGYNSGIKKRQILQMTVQDVSTTVPDIERRRKKLPLIPRKPKQIMYEV